MPITVTGHRSTSLSPQGYAQVMAGLMPRRWYPDSDLQPGGVAYPILYGFGAGLDALDQQQNQVVLSMLRLQTSTGADIGSWSSDFFATLLPVQPNEPDSAYIARLTAWLQAQKCTLAGIASAVSAYVGIVNYLPRQRAIGVDTYGGLDTSGSLDNPIPANSGSQSGIAVDTQGGLDTQGGMDISSPAFNPATVIVFDTQSNPTLAASVGLTAGQFCVYFQYPGYSDALIHVIGAYSNILAQFVNAVKAEGTTAVYASNNN